MSTTTNNSGQRFTRRVVLGLAGGAVLILAAVLVFTRLWPSDVITLPPSASPATTCTTGSTVPVTVLAENTWRTCDLNGSQVVFPDNTTVEVTAFGSSSGLDNGPGKARYYVENLGTYGVVAVKALDGKRQYWGADKGVALVKARRSKV